MRTIAQEKKRNSKVKGIGKRSVSIIMAEYDREKALKDKQNDKNSCK